jgi:undecaprenyl-diphosphatase
MDKIDIERGETSSLGRSRALIAWSLTMAVVIAVFGWLAKEVIVVKTETLSFDIMAHNVIHAWAWPSSTTAIMQVVTNLGSWKLLFGWLILVGLLVAKGHKCAALMSAITAIGGVLLAEGLKRWIDRPRPFPFWPPPPTDQYGFPSGHAMASFCFFVVLAGILAHWLHSRAAKLAAWTGAALMTALVGFSRVYLGYHYPTDVLGGYVAGFIWLIAAWRGYHIWTQRAVHKTNASTGQQDHIGPDMRESVNVQ